MRHFLLVLFSFNNSSLDWEGGRGEKIPIKTMCAGERQQHGHREGVRTSPRRKAVVFCSL